MFNISRGSLYNWIKLFKNDNLCEKKKYNKISKYDKNVKKYIINYVIKKVNFDYKKLIRMIKSKYKMESSKSAIYVILKENNI